MDKHWGAMRICGFKRGRWLWTFLGTATLAACFGGEGSNPATFPAATFTTMTPVTAVMGAATTFTVTGQNLPLTAILTVPDGVCSTPTNRTATGFTDVCTLSGAASSQVITVSTDTAANKGWWLGMQTITVSGTPATPVAPAATFSGFSPMAAMLGQATTFTITGANFPLTSYGTLADGTCLTPTSRSSTGFTVQCTPGGVAGTQLFSIRSDTVANGGYLLGTLNIAVSATPVPPAPTFSGFSPTAAVLGQVTTFTITGANFPLTAYGTLDNGTCLTPTSRSSTGFTMQCTPGGVAGTQIFSIRSDTVANGGYLLGTQNITVSTTPVPPAPVFSGFTPLAAMLGQATTFTVTGENFPLTAYGTLDNGTCLTPTSRSSTGFTVQCTPGGVAGAQIFTIRSDTVANGGYVLGTPSITVSTTPVPPAPTFSGFSPLAATLGQATTFTVTGANFPLTAYGTLANATCLTPTNRSSTGFTVQCTPGGVAGIQIFTIRSDTVANGGYLLGTLNITVSTTPVPPAPTFTGFSPTATMLGQPTIFTITGTNFPLTAYASLANGTCLTPTNRSSTGFTVQCTPSGVAGTQLFSIRSDTVANGGYLLGSLNITILAGP